MMMMMMIIIIITVIIIIIIKSVAPIRSVLSSFHFCLSAARNLSSFQLLSASFITDLLQLFSGLLFLLS
jgi:hypothetical protein